MTRAALLTVLFVAGIAAASPSRADGIPVEPRPHHGWGGAPRPHHRSPPRPYAAAGYEAGPVEGSLYQDWPDTASVRIPLYNRPSGHPHF